MAHVLVLRPESMLGDLIVCPVITSGALHSKALSYVQEIIYGDGDLLFDDVPP